MSALLYCSCLVSLFWGCSATGINSLSLLYWYYRELLSALSRVCRLYRSIPKLFLLFFYRRFYMPQPGIPAGIISKLYQPHYKGSCRARTIYHLLVAVAAHMLIPGLSWPVAFLIGAIVSPPDAVAATSVTKGLGLHPKLITVLEGESLVNDASGLIAYKYALTAIMAGNFVLWQAGLNFLLVVAAGVAIGLAIGYIMYLVHKKFVCDPVIEVTLTFLTPFASYLLAEQFSFFRRHRRCYYGLVSFFSFGPDIQS